MHEVLGLNPEVMHIFENAIYCFIRVCPMTFSVILDYSCMKLVVLSIYLYKASDTFPRSLYYHIPVHTGKHRYILVQTSIP
jgi:hypothetical protein